VTDCAGIRALVEKLADSEATAAEKREAEAHLERCPSCQSHAAFLAFLEEESRAAPPEPPASYWEHLPRKVLDRIDSEGRRPSGFSRILLAPWMLRLGALGATLVLVTALGVTVLRERVKTPVPAASAPAPATEALESEAPAPERIASPPMARDEAAAPAAGGGEALPEAAESGTISVDSQAPPPVPPEESDVSLESNEVDVSSLRAAAREPRENAPVPENAVRARPASAASPGAALADCDALRRTVAAIGTEASEDRYRLALCSLERYEREATEELRALAIEDAEAFLAGESDGSRAEEIRGKLQRVR